MSRDITRLSRDSNIGTSKFLHLSQRKWRGKRYEGGKRPFRQSESEAGGAPEAVRKYESFRVGGF